MWVKARGLYIFICPRKYGNSGALEQEQLVTTEAMLA